MDQELKMALYDDLIAALPELTDADFAPITGTIVLQNDADEIGDYIAKWEHATPLPKPFKVGK
jgi:hypothetical protein